LSRLEDYATSAETESNLYGKLESKPGLAFKPEFKILRRQFFAVRRMTGGRLQRLAVRNDRFQRAKAASRMFSNRNGRGGDFEIYL